MKDYKNSLIRKHRKLEQQLSTDNQDPEQMRELRRLQQNLAERIQQIQRGPQRNSA
ncbi:hypothetical protein [Parasphingorhabdus sp.]|jgi:hypothetical protein|uniref:hypothetical protein n=1 Tax=Parasphingorhabdus sp. TaxID=2709688 RepID=UPI001372FCEB